MKKRIAALVMAICLSMTFKTYATEQPLYEDAIKEKITAYCSCYECCGKTDGITASGKMVRKGICASSVPEYYGKAIVVYNDDWTVYGIYECLDKGTDHIDIYFESHDEAIQFGTTTKWIRVLDCKG